MKRFFKDKRTIVLLIALALAGIDQLIKLIVTMTIKEYQSIVVIPGILRITNIHNKGAAFGILGGRDFFLIIVTAIVLIALLVFIIKSKNKISILIPLGMIFAGGLGNLLDRVIRREVIDYIDLKFWPFNDFAIFNMSDLLVVFGSIILVITVIIKDIVQYTKSKKSKPKNKKEKADDNSSKQIQNKVKAESFKYNDTIEQMKQTIEREQAKMKYNSPNQGRVPTNNEGDKVKYKPKKNKHE